MHGRVKVKSTEEQKEAKERERARKLEVYRSTSSAVFNKRRDAVCDQEALDLTGQILSANPDLSAFWNFRREIFLSFSAEKTEEEMQTLYERELPFLESCLRVNPKSYGTWFHRRWVLEHQPRPDWAEELRLCVTALERDERNFHCWDYRRFVVQTSGVSPESELEFSDRLIASNFSNYSSWHYRSKILPLVYPDPRNLGRLQEPALLKEYSLVQNAFFTDPNDQSAWFYHRWLLGRAEKQTRIICLYVNFAEDRLTVAFSTPVNVLKDSSKMIVMIDRKMVEGFWFPGNNSPTNAIWTCSLPEGALIPINSPQNVRVIWDENGSERDCYCVEKSDGWSRESATESQLFRSELSVETSTVLQSELESCQQLQDLEPDNKWCLLTLVTLMRALDPLGYERETLRHVERLTATDGMRRRYFSDLRSRFLVEDGILRMEYAETRALDLSAKALTTLCHLEQLLLVSHLDLSANRLLSLGPSFCALQNLQVLEADDNEITSIEGIGYLTKLEEISLKNNRLEDVVSLQPLGRCRRLAVVCLSGNPVCSTPDIVSNLRHLLPRTAEITV